MNWLKSLSDWLRGRQGSDQSVEQVKSKNKKCLDCVAYGSDLAVTKLYNRLSAEEAGTPASNTAATNAIVSSVFCQARKNQADADLPDDGERNVDRFLPEWQKHHGKVMQ